MWLWLVFIFYFTLFYLSYWVPPWKPRNVTGASSIKIIWYLFICLFVCLFIYLFIYLPCLFQSLTIIYIDLAYYKFPTVSNWSLSGHCRHYVRYLNCARSFLFVFLLVILDYFVIRVHLVPLMETRNSSRWQGLLRKAISNLKKQI